MAPSRFSFLILLPDLLSNTTLTISVRHAGNVLFVEYDDFNIGGANVTTKAVGRLGDRPFAFRL